LKGSSYILSAAFIHLIRNPDFSIYARLNLLYYIFDWIKARFYFEQNEELKKELEEIEKELIELRDVYEPLLDDDVKFSALKRAEFEKAMDKVRFRIVNIVENFELLDAGMISEFYIGGGKR